MLSITSADVVLYKTIFWVKGISSLEMLVVLALHANGSQDTPYNCSGFYMLMDHKIHNIYFYSLCEPFFGGGGYVIT